MRDAPIKVLVVEDSQVVRAMLVQILSGDPQIKVIGTATNGKETLAFLVENAVDVVLMDIEMPEMDGFETTRQIMETNPLPIIICSGSTSPKETMTTFRSMEAGAVACIEKPVGLNHQDFDEMARHLIQTVKLMSEVKVVRRWSRGREIAQPAPRRRRAPSQVDLIGIGASTGGPPVLQTIFTALAKDFPVPLLVVQHIAPGFLPGLVEWLNQTTGMKVHVAAYGMTPMPGHAYLAPDNFHMTIGRGGEILLCKEGSENGLRPSIAQLFRSLAEVCAKSAVGVILTGMGKDGAAELKLMRDRGATTIAQDQATSVVHGMPGEAIALGGASFVLPAQRIGPMLDTLAHTRYSNGESQ